MAMLEIAPAVRVALDEAQLAPALERFERGEGSCVVCARRMEGPAPAGWSLVVFRGSTDQLVVSFTHHGCMASRVVQGT
jgi:hypothetical protein